MDKSKFGTVHVSKYPLGHLEKSPIFWTSGKKRLRTDGRTYLKIKKEDLSPPILLKNHTSQETCSHNIHHTPLHPYFQDVT